MAKLKEKVLQALQNVKKVEPTLDYLTQAQENLLKNYSNPVFNKKDKNKILKNYSDLQNLGKSLYRYGALKENNYFADAQEEKEDIEKTVLKTGISYNKYVWHSDKDEKTCDKCKELDGQVFEMDEEVPERPHPNCRCTVEIVEGEIETDGEEPQEDKDKIPPHTPTPRPPAPQPEPSPKPTPQPKTPPQPQKWIMPCQGRISSGYGKRKPPVPGASAWHNGWDIEVPIGTPIKAVADGKVIATGAAKGYGYWVAIDHGIINGVQVTSEYGHISSWNVRYGQIIKQGDIIAKSGNAGYSSGPHLHITIREGHFQGTAVAPSKYIRTNF